MPIDALTCASPPVKMHGGWSDAAMRSHSELTDAAVTSVSMSTTNSSPPRRATTSLCRVMLSKRRAISHSTSSPTPWPYASFTPLNPSRSTNSSASASSLPHFRLLRDTDCSSRSVNARRLHNPVSESRVAICCNCASASVRAVVFCTSDIIELTLPAASVSAELNHSQYTVLPL